MAIPNLRRIPRTKALVQLEERVLAALADMKAVNVRVLDVRGLTDVADTMIVASGTSDRHVRSIADLVIERAKQAGRRPMGTEGQGDAEWVLVDLQDVLVHVMLPRVREFYALEQLWEAPVAARQANDKVLKKKTARKTNRAARPGAARARASGKPAARGKAATGGRGAAARKPARRRV